MLLWRGGISLFLSPPTCFVDLVWIASILIVCAFQVITKLGGSTSHIFSSEWRSSSDVIRIKHIHVILLTRQTVLAARLVLCEDWVLIVPTAFRQRKRELRKRNKIS